MTIELTYLAATLILAFVQILLPAAARTAEYGAQVERRAARRRTCRRRAG